MNLKELAQKEERFTSGHRMCAGCAAPIIVRDVLAATDSKVVAANATGCLEVASTIYPYSSWAVPWIHTAFENAAATISGVEAAYQYLKRMGKMKEDVKFVAFGGDGGTYDIGLQSLSGALERGHDFTYVCYDNGAYMNTGGQRSSATPMGASTTTAPAGKVHKGKEEWRKDLMQIAAAHHIPYVGQSSVSNWSDLLRKAEDAHKAEGPAVLLVLSPCTTLWGFRTNNSIEIAKMAVETRFWPLYECVDGEWKLNYKPKNELTFRDFIKGQARFKHLLKEDVLLDTIQERIEKEWTRILKLCGEQ
jgi:pyruvate ferredoxin oxidoreductase beta subunit